MGVTHKPKSGATLTGTEYEAADSHITSIAHVDLTGVTANQHHAQSHTQTDHTGTGATSTQAFGDAAADGTGTKPANIDHKHGMPADPVTAHVAASDPHPVYMTSAETLAVKLDDFAATDDNTDLNASTTAHGLMQKYPGGTTTFLRADGAFATPTASAAVTYTDFTKDLGAAYRSGTFDLTGLSGLTADKPVNAMQTAAAISSKGNARDEPEMDQIQLTGYVVNATTIRFYWQAPSVVVGTYAFAYLVGA